MKTKNLLFVIIALFPIGIMAQSSITLGATYLPYENEILIHVVNSAAKPMVIYNNYGGGGSGSIIEFRLKDKAGKEISLYDAGLFEGIKYQHSVEINARSTKTFRFPLKFLCPSDSNLSDIYSVDVNCYISYSNSEKNERIHKLFPLKTKQDLMISTMYDSHYQNIMIVLSNTSDYEMTVHNSGTSSVQFVFLNQQGTQLGTRSTTLRLEGTGTFPSTIKIAPRSVARLAYLYSNIMTNGIAGQSQITTVDVNSKVIYSIPARSITNASSQRTTTIKVK